MTHGPHSTPSSSKAAAFILYVAAVLTVVMVLFPPFTSLNGTEYAFLLTGPEWSRHIGTLGDDLGLTARLHWVLLFAQLATVWAIAVGAKKFLAAQPPASMLSPALTGSFALLFTTCAFGQHLPTDVRHAEPAVYASEEAVSPGTFNAVPAGAAAVQTADSIGVTTVGVQGGRYGVGFASSWPAYGLSGTLQVSEKMTAEAVLGFLGTISNFGGRLWYRFNRSPKYDFYGFGAASLYRYRYTTYDSRFEIRRATENVLGIGGGAGLEIGLQSFFEDEELPPIFFNWEIGLSVASFEYYDFSSFIFGGGIHYRFGQ